MTNFQVRHYFDTNALWKFYIDQKGSLNVRRLVSNVSHPILVSSLTKLELINVLMKQLRQGYLKRRVTNNITKSLRVDIGSSDNKNRPFIMVPFPDMLFVSAERVLLSYADTFQVGTNDGLHIAIVLTLQQSFPDIVMVTSDNSVQRVCERVGVTFYDPEIG